MEKIIAACGNDCAMCPRYNVEPYKKSEEELSKTAELWFKIGYRDHLVSNREIECHGCKPGNWCRYKVIDCTDRLRIDSCGQCYKYPCDTIKECFEVTASFTPSCRAACTDEEYDIMKSAFFEKEKNLNERHEKMADWQLDKVRLVEEYSIRNQTALNGQILFAGSSLMEMFPIEEWCGEYGVTIYNRGVGGHTTTDMLRILDIAVLELKPRKLFINIGTNDLSRPDLSIAQIMDNYDRILTIIEDNIPGIEIYLMAYYPINYDAAADYMKPVLAVRTNEKIELANKEVSKLAASHNQKYIDVNNKLKDSEGRLKAEYTIEGMHIKPEGYRAILDDVMRYVME